MGYFNTYGQWISDDSELYHHGILGMKWGHREGPPYPLDASDHSAAEKKAGWKKSLDGGSGSMSARDKKKLAKYKAKNMEKLSKKRKTNLTSIDEDIEIAGYRRDRAKAKGNFKKVAKYTKAISEAQKDKGRELARRALEESWVKNATLDDIKGERKYMGKMLLKYYFTRIGGTPEFLLNSNRIREDYRINQQLHKEKLQKMAGVASTNSSRKATSTKNQKFSGGFRVSWDEDTGEFTSIRGKNGKEMSFDEFLEAQEREEERERRKQRR